MDESDETILAVRAGSDAAGPLQRVPVAPDDAHRRRLRIVQAAEAALLQRHCEPPRPLLATCRSLGVSPRALHGAFVAVHGVSPGRYLRDRRLALVREALRAAPERRSAVKQAALALGFRHLGHFAQAYRDRFGELPTETIAREMSRGRENSVA